MTDKPSVLVFAPVYEPGFKSGGPVRSITNMVERLGGDITFRIITADRDRGAGGAYPGIEPGIWQRRGRASVIYLPPAKLNLACIARLIRSTPHTIAYLNSFFDPRFATLPLMARRLGPAPRTPVVLAPRGEFSQSALALKPNRKRAFLIFSRTLQLHHHVIWQASTRHEADDIERTLPGIARDIRIAPDLAMQVDRGSEPWRSRRPGQALRIAYLSRIAPMKNLLFALQVLREVTVPTVFTIHGPCVDSAYWSACEAAIATLPAHVEVRHAGPVPPDQVSAVLGQNDLFFLPTRGENFGHVIIEALQAGTPALISDRTPWRGLAAAGAGADLPLEVPSAFAAFIEEMARQTSRQAMRMRRRAASFARSMLDEEAALAANRALFHAVPSDDRGGPAR